MAGLLQRIGLADGPADLLGLMREGIALLGAEQAYFVSAVHGARGLCACRYLLACDEAWFVRYQAEGGASRDPWLAYATHHSEPASGQDPALQQAGRSALPAIAAEHGFRSVLLVPAHSGIAQARISLLCLGHTQSGHFENAGSGPARILARALACELHEWWTTRIRRELLASTHLTETELDLLRLQHAGLCSKRIAAELHVSTSSIDSRFQRLHLKLGVASRRHAARLLVDCGLLLP